MKKIFQFLLSMRFTAILFVAFVVSVAVATFIENDFGPASARAVIYNATWFEILFLLIIINLSGSIIQNKLYLKEKFAFFVFHLAFVIIIIGAAITRFTGFEGIMHIREGHTSDTIMTQENYITITAISGEDRISLPEKVLFSPITRNSYEEEFLINGRKFVVNLKEYIADAEEMIARDTINGKPLMQLFVRDINQSISFIFRDKEIKEINGVRFIFNDTIQKGVNIFIEGGKLFLKSSFNFSELVLTDQSEVSFKKDSIYPFIPKKIFKFKNVSCSFGDFNEKGIIKATNLKDENRQKDIEALVMEVNSLDLSEEVTILYNKNQNINNEIINLDGIELGLKYGPIPMQIPFSLQLIDFNVDQYPGTETPSSFESKIVLIDNPRGIQDTGKIFMNNILNYKGYRFYQSSYDPDEHGTILSVNRDLPGTLVTYIGYALMVIGMILSLFNPSGYFRKLIERSEKIKPSRQLILSPIILICSLTIPSYQSYGQDNLEINPRVIIPPEKAKLFGKLWVHGQDGRFKPLNTLSSEILRKVHGKSTFMGLNSDQVFLSMIVYPDYWKTLPLIKVSNTNLRDTLKITDYASFEDLKTFKGYVLKPYVETALLKMPYARSKFDNEVLKVDERFQICDLSYTGSIARFFPSKPIQMDNLFNEFPEETQFVTVVMSQYIQGLLDGMETGNYSNADRSLSILWNYQIQNGQRILPSFARTNLEIFYNKVQIFEWLSLLYGVIGSVLLVLTLIAIFIQKLRLEKFIRVSAWFIFACFLLHSGGLIMRWYIAGHAPWSDGYESMLFISLANILTGIIFAKRSPITLAVTAIFSFLVLYVAHLSWMDPEITRLVPVLRSYWLIIHVAVITSSYAFFGIITFLGIINLAMMAMKNNVNAYKIEPIINELTRIMEIAIITGLYLLATGTILGGVWANESWGRYWGWDPKESWTLITIIVYAFIAHMRLIPGLTSVYLFNLLSVLGFASVIMTFFGVNYFLSGLHSYARGEQPPVSGIVYFILGFIVGLALLAYLKQRKISGIEKSQ